MKKYFAVLKIIFKAQLVYRFDVIMTALGTMWRVALAWILWGAIFEGRAEVGGFSRQAMLTYYVLSSFMAATDMSGGVSGEVSARIREGTFTKYMVIPSNPLTHFTAQSFGAFGYYALFAALAAAVSARIFDVRFAMTGDLMTITLAIIMFLLGMVFMNCYQFFVGLWAFKFHDIGFMLHVLMGSIAFLKGEYVPLSLMPEAIVKALRYLPFTHVSYSPIMLLTGNTGIKDGLASLAVLFIWVCIMAAVSQLTYGKLRVKYEGVGI